MPKTSDVFGPLVILNAPGVVAERLVASSRHYGLTAAEVRFHHGTTVIFWLTLNPWAPLAAEDYPTERVAITVRADGSIFAVPVDGRHRTWLHRNLRVPFSLDYIGDLCLWYRDDPRALRWAWADGLDAYVTIVHRHLQAEEYYRRNRLWPSEDAPHGAGPHPIRTEAMRRIASQGAVA